MTGRHKFSEIMAAMTPARQRRIDALAEQLGEIVDAAHPPSLSATIVEMLEAYPAGLTRAEIMRKLKGERGDIEEATVAAALLALEAQGRVKAGRAKYIASREPAPPLVMRST